MTAGTGGIDGYLADLRAQLAPGDRRTSLALEEVADHLHQAAEHYRCRGLPAASAEQAAVDEFGSARVVAAGFAAVLAVARVRAAGRALAAGVCLLAAAWAAGTLVGPPLPWADDHEPSAVLLAEGIAVVAFRVAVLATVATAVLGRRGRHLGAAGPVRWLARSSAAAYLALLTSVGAAAAYQVERYLLASRPQPAPGRLVVGLLVAGVVATLAGAGWSVVRAVRASIPARRAADPGQDGPDDGRDATTPGWR